jgi:hypothetical protein
MNDYFLIELHEIDDTSDKLLLFTVVLFKLLSTHKQILYNYI